jgi:hypothetical protein
MNSMLTMSGVEDAKWPDWFYCKHMHDNILFVLYIFGIYKLFLYAILVFLLSYTF